MARITYNDIPAGMFEKLMDIEGFVNKSTIESKMLELMRLRAAQINGCAYCVDMHFKELQHIGETDLRLSSLCIWQDTPYFSDKERAVLAFTEAVTRISAAPISEDIFNSISNHYSKEEIAYLTLAISQINTLTRLMITFQFTPGNHRVKELA